MVGSTRFYLIRVRQKPAGCDISLQMYKELPEAFGP